MTNTFRNFSIKLSILLSTFVISGFAQSPKTDPGAYMNRITTAYNEVTQQFLEYVSAVNHGKSARKVEKRRKELLSTISAKRSQMKSMQGFEGDTTLKSASYTYLDLSFKILKEDYDKIVDMEEIAEQSYDNMEAYLLTQEKADEKLKEAGEIVDNSQRAFAEKHGITLRENHSELARKSEKVGKTTNYYNMVYLIFFKSYKQEAYLLKAIEENNVSGIEQNKIALANTSQEGLSKLDTIKSFMGDNSLAIACKKMLQFYQTETTKIDPMVEFIMKNEKMEEEKKALGTSPTKEQVDHYNNGLADLNKASQTFNKSNKDLFNTRGTLLNGWNNSTQAFLNKHTPQAN